MKKSLTAVLSIVLCLLLFSAATFAATDNKGETDSVFATDLTSQCRLETSMHDSGIVRMTDDDIYTKQTLRKGSYLSFSWIRSLGAKYLFLSWFELPECVTITQTDDSGQVTKRQKYAPEILDELIEFEEGTTTVTIYANAPLNLTTLHIYSGGILPDGCHPWLPTPGKLDFLMVATHPDDDIFFLGGIMPIYGGERGYTGTAVYMTTQTRRRCSEAMNGLWAMGGRSNPLFAGFADIGEGKLDNYNSKLFLYEDMVLYLVRQFRSLRPEVVITQDLDGEYGHFQHKAVVKAVLEAAYLCNIPRFDAASTQQYGTFQIKKVYVHLYEKNPLVLDMDAPLASFGGLNAYEVDRLAFACHLSQKGSRFQQNIGKDNAVSAKRFGLAYTTVGLDTPGENDMFEHIDLESIVGFEDPIAMG